jgi:hypothetical protein
VRWPYSYFLQAGIQHISIAIIQLSSITSIQLKGITVLNAAGDYRVPAIA